MGSALGTGKMSSVTIGTMTVVAFQGTSNIVCAHAAMGSHDNSLCGNG